MDPCVHPVALTRRADSFNAVARAGQRQKQLRWQFLAPSRDMRDEHPANRVMKPVDDRGVANAVAVIYDEDGPHGLHQCWLVAQDPVLE